MNKVFVDSNVFLRFMVADDEKQRQAAKALLTAAEKGKLQMVTGPPVFFEIAWVLRTKYKFSGERILDVLTSILGLTGLHVLDSRIVSAALENARKHGQDYADAYIVATADQENIAELATFNTRHFKNKGIALHEFGKDISAKPPRKRKGGT
jgi:predicted nucleic acid-binding protein